MADEQNQAEALDEDKLGGEFPPDKPLGKDAYGAAGAEPHADENVVARAAREEPEDVPLESPPTAGDVEAGLDPYDQVVLSEEDQFTGDETVRDVVQEREAPIPAEEAALHVEVPEGEPPA